MVFVDESEVEELFLASDGYVGGQCAVRVGSVWIVVRREEGSAAGGSEAGVFVEDVFFPRSCSCRQRT